MTSIVIHDIGSTLGFFSEILQNKFLELDYFTGQVDRILTFKVELIKMLKNIKNNIKIFNKLLFISKFEFKFQGCKKIHYSSTDSKMLSISYYLLFVLYYF